MEFKWEDKKLSEIGYIVTGKTPSTKIEKNFGDRVPFLTPSDDMDARYVYETKRYLSDEGVNEVRKKLIPKNSICISCIGSQLGKVTITTEETVTNQQINSIVINDEYNIHFIYYLLLILGQKLNFLSKSSTAVPIINKKFFSEISVKVPQRQLQDKIAILLDSLDSKIEINNKIISNLESQAQAIFKSWFVDFEPFQDGDFVESELGMIPEGWEVKELGELFKFVKGKKPKDLHEKYEDNFIPYIVKGVMDGSETSKFTNEINIVKIKKLDCFMLMDGANSGNIYYGYDGALGSTFALLESKNQVYRELIYWKLKTNESIIKNQNTGSAIPHANKDFISKMNVAIPINIEENVIVKTLENFRIKINSLNNQNTKLAELRDALLPKLMAGEIDVSNIKIEGEEVKNE